MVTCDATIRSLLAMDLCRPTRLARGAVIDDTYEIGEQLGVGGMGRVYRARDRRLGRDVAIKLHASFARADAARKDDPLRREASVLARLSHANVVTVYTTGTWSDQPWVAMEYVPGTARSWLAAEPRTKHEIVAIYVAAGRGLAAAHAAGLVHCDFKPENVLVGDDGRVRVADFGLARECDDGGEDGWVGSGTPVNMAPEQHAGAGVGPATDQFAFAVTLWEALTGHRPFAGSTSRELVNAKIAPPKRPLERHIERALRRALEADPAARWPSMTALLDALIDVAPRRTRRTRKASNAGASRRVS